MALISQEQIDQIALRTYDVIWKSEKLGVTVANSVNFNWEMVTSPVDDVDQVDGVVQEFYKFTNHSPISMDLANTTSSFFRSIFEDLYNIETNGQDSVLRTGLNQQSLRELAGFLRLHPTSLPSTNLNEDLFVHLAFPKVTSPITGDRDTRQQISIEFTAYPDTNQADNEEYGGYGDYSLTTQTPYSVWIEAATTLQEYSPGELVADVNADQIIKRECFASYKTDTGDTCDANGAGTATDLTIIFDGLTTAGALLADEYITIGTEAIRIESVSYTDSTQLAGTITVSGRGDLGTTAASFLDDAVITLVDLARIKRTSSATWASATPAAATVGDTRFVDGSIAPASRKGYIEHVAAGSTNITATVNAVASPNFVVTAN